MVPWAANASDLYLQRSSSKKVGLSQGLAMMAKASFGTCINFAALHPNVLVRPATNRTATPCNVFRSRSVVPFGGASTYASAATASSPRISQGGIVPNRSQPRRTAITRISSACAAARRMLGVARRFKASASTTGVS